jgi:hypothetical protein
MSKVSNVLTATRNALQAPVVVRCLKSFATNVSGFEPGHYYSVPAGDAAAWSRINFVRPVTDAAELADAEDAIAKRNELD